MSLSRRQFTRLLAGVTGGLALGQVSVNGAAAGNENYRAIVGVFLFGGNDGWNTVVPTDGRYSAYASQRGADLTLPQAKLTPLGGVPFGLHPSLKPLGAIWDEGAMGIVLNTGNLHQPLDRNLYLARPDLRPQSLMSHADQQNQWQTSRARQEGTDGFLGRINDYATPTALPSLMCMSGSNIALVGGRSAPLVLPETGMASRLGYEAASANPTTIARQTALASFSSPGAIGEVTELTAGSINTAYGQADAVNAVLSVASSVDSFFVDSAGAPLSSSIALQLKRTAFLIASRQTLGHARQSFFVSQEGYDTHANQTDDASPTTGTHADLLTDFALAVSAFHAAIKALGLSNQVTLFTMSDFGRVYRGNAQRGSDHAWGSNHLVIGGALADHKVHGRYPDTTFGGGEDSGVDGRWIPSISVEEYLGPIVKWFGVTDANLPYVFPNWLTWTAAGRGPVPLYG